MDNSYVAEEIPKKVKIITGVLLPGSEVNFTFRFDAIVDELLPVLILENPSSSLQIDNSTNAPPIIL